MDMNTTSVIEIARSHQSNEAIVARIGEIAQTLGIAELLSLLAYASECAKRDESPRARAASAMSLTNREKEVLVLVAHGYSRRSIGDSLGISMNTASRHIANIYGKLGISSVAEATQWAFINELIAVHAGDTADELGVNNTFHFNAIIDARVTVSRNDVFLHQNPFNK